jgi:L-ascorbate metabolism protein UlaG (beta-lactamase superfamily)
MNENGSPRPYTIPRRTFLWLVATSLLAACCPSPQPGAGDQPATRESGVASTAAPPSPAQTSTPAEAPSPELPAILGRLHWLGHASFRLDGPPTIYFDPRGLGDDPPPAGIILISHDHDDHFSISDLKAIGGPETVIITISSVATRLEEAGVTYHEVQAVRPGERMKVGDVEIETVPAYNVDKSYHPKEAGYLGFIVTLQGERLYFAGDTDRISEMSSIECDVALLPIGGMYTMDVEEAAQAAADIGPRVAVPMHERNADPNVFRDLCDCPVVVMEIEGS